MQITGVGSRIVVQVASIMIMIVAIIGESKAPETLHHARLWLSSVSRWRWHCFQKIVVNSTPAPGARHLVGKASHTLHTRTTVLHVIPVLRVALRHCHSGWRRQIRRPVCVHATGNGVGPLLCHVWCATDTIPFSVFPSDPCLTTCAAGKTRTASMMYAISDFTFLVAGIIAAVGLSQFQVGAVMVDNIDTRVICCIGPISLPFDL